MCFHSCAASYAALISSASRAASLRAAATSAASASQSSRPASMRRAGNVVVETGIEAGRGMSFHFIREIDCHDFAACSSKHFLQNQSPHTLHLR
jgi:hypothetical protein